MVLDVVLVICLELGSNAVESTLEGILGGGVDHLGLLHSQHQTVARPREETRLTWMPASSGDQAIKVILLLLNYQHHSRFSLANITHLAPSPEARS